MIIYLRNWLILRSRAQGNNVFCFSYGNEDLKGLIEHSIGPFLYLNEGKADADVLNINLF